MFYNLPASLFNNLYMRYIRLNTDYDSYNKERLYHQFRGTVTFDFAEIATKNFWQMNRQKN